MSLLDKMMRVAGRSSDGLARAIKTSEKGEVITMLGGSISKEIVIFENITSSGWANHEDVTEFSGLLLTVNGTFTGTINATVLLNGELTAIPVVDYLTNELVIGGEISKSGVYFLNLTGVTSLRMRAENLKSAIGVAVKGTLFSEPLDRQVITTPSDRIVELASYTGTVDPGDNLVLPDIKMSGFVFYFIQVSAQTTWDVYAQNLRTSASGFEGKQKILSGTYRAISEWQDVRGTSMNIFFTSYAEEPITSNVIIKVLGVR